MRHPNGSTHWKKQRSPTARTLLPTPSMTSYPPTTDGSAETSDFQGGTYVRISPPPPIPRDSPGLPAACLMPASCLPHARLMPASCLPHACLLPGARLPHVGLIYLCQSLPAFLHMYIVRLRPTIPLYNSPYILLYS